MMTKTFKSGIILLFALMFAFKLNAQPKRFRGKPIEVGITLGASNYMGDLTPLVALNESHPMGGIVCRFNYSDFLTLRGNAVFGQISGNDQNYSSDAAYRKRNLSFKSNIMEFSGTLEWNILGFGETQRTNPGTPFLFAGIGVFKFNPMAQFKYIPGLYDPADYGDLSKYDGKWIELQPLSTEGQETTKYNSRKRYSLTQVSIPIGVGYKKQFSEIWAWGVEFGLRKTFTDYLDDVSLTYIDAQITTGANTGLSSAFADRTPELQDPSLGINDVGTNETLGAPRGDASQNKDWYMFFNFTLTRKIVGGKQTCFQF
jgi:hypothetical protein